MSPEAQRIAIAEACGITVLEGCAVDFSIHPEPGHGNLVPLPDYLNDLNAMHEAEKTLTGAQALVYATTLNRVTNSFQHITTFVAIHATASQRAEAFLRTLNLWK